MSSLSTKSEEAIEAQIGGRKPKKYEGMTRKEEMAARMAEELEKKKKKKLTEAEIAERYKKNLEVNEKFISGGK